MIKKVGSKMLSRDMLIVIGDDSIEEQRRDSFTHSHTHAHAVCSTEQTVEYRNSVHFASRDSFSFHLHIHVIHSTTVCITFIIHHTYICHSNWRVSTWIAWRLLNILWLPNIYIIFIRGVRKHEQKRPSYKPTTTTTT